jgi:hypothetical protein
LKSALEKFKPETFGREIQRIGLDITNERVTVRYNVPLNYHSGQLILTYDKLTEKLTLTGQLLGLARTRWPLFAKMGAILSEAGILPFSKALVQGEQEVVFFWRIENEEMLKIALEEYANMAEVSQGKKPEYFEIYEMYERRKNAELTEYFITNGFGKTFIYTDYFKKILDQISLSDWLIDASDTSQLKAITFSLLKSDNEKLKTLFMEAFYEKNKKMHIKKIENDPVLQHAEKKLLKEVTEKINIFDHIIIDIIKKEFINSNEKSTAGSFLLNFIKHRHKVNESIQLILRLALDNSDEISYFLRSLLENLIQIDRSLS